ncbi:MAG: hypothetical protein JW881_14105 [Spirochaetales bacterium]|nr:hypothetical protein [Spirochaetales bacterium]
MPTAAPTAVPGGREGGEVWLVPEELTVKNSDKFTIEVHCHTGEQKLAAYGISIKYNTFNLDVDTDIGTNGVEAGPDGFVAAANAVEETGTLVMSGFDTGGKGPSEDLNLFITHWIAIESGTTVLEVTIVDLVDENTDPIANQIANDGSVTIQ